MVRNEQAEADEQPGKADAQRGFGWIVPPSDGLIPHDQGENPSNEQVDGS